MPTTAYTDGSFVYPSQHGARQVSLPLIQDQEYYCTQTIRQMQQLAQFWEPSLYQRTAYTNVLTYSDAASNAAWTKVAVTVAAEASTDPEGGSTASSIAETTANSAHSIAQAATGTGVVTFGAFVKARERTFVRLRINNSTNGNFAIAIFNLTLGKTESGTGTIKKMPGGWMYCTVSGTATVSGNTCYVELASNASTTSYAGTIGSGLYTWRLNAVFASSVSPVPVTTAATPAIHTDGASVEATVPLVDPDDPLSFLVDESAPDQSTLELGVSQWQRTFCRVSRQTTTPSSIIVSKPAPLGSGSTILGTNVFFHQPESAYSTYDIYTVTDVDFDYGAPAFTISAGTYTLTVGSYTTASINYNATAGDVQSALNAIPSVVSAGLATVTGDATEGAGFTVVFGSAATYGYIDPTVGLGSLTPGGGVFVGQGGGSGGTGPTDPYRLYEIVRQGTGITGGTYALTFPLGGDTTSALDYDATSAEIGAALNALPSIIAIGGITMYDGPQGATGYDPASQSIKFSFYFSTPTITGDVSLLEPPPVTLLVTLEPNRYGRTQYVFLSAGNNYRFLTANSHGISSGDTMFIEASYVSSTSPATAYSTTYYVPVTNFTVPDANSIGLTGTPIDPYMTAATITKVGRRSFIGYSPGPQNVRSRKVTDYYLPGFTPNIATFEDIPVVESQNDGEPFFSALIAGGDINYVVGELGVWRGPIVYQQKTLINAQDIGEYVATAIAPSEIGGLEFHFDATTISGISDGGTITTWNDISGNARNITQPTAGARPYYFTDIQNSLPVVRLVRTTARYFDQNANQVSAKTLIVVGKITASTFNTGNGPCDLYQSTQLGFEGNGTGTAWRAVSGFTYYRDGSRQADMGADPTNPHVYILTGPNAVLSVLQVGITDGNTAKGINMDLYEVLVYSEELTADQCAGISQYFENKWGI